MERYEGLTPEERARNNGNSDLLIERYVEQKEAVEEGREIRAKELEVEINDLLREKENVEEWGAVGSAGKRLSRRNRAGGRAPARGGEAELPSAFPENALDRADANPVDLGNLGNRHSVLHPGSDASKLGDRDLGHHSLPGADWSVDLLETDRRRGRGCQHARLARRLVGRRQRRVRNRLLGDLPFRGEQRLGRFARARQPLGIVTARVRFLLPSVKQKLLRTIYAFARSKRGFGNFDKLDLGSRGPIRKLDHLMPKARAASKDG